MHLRTQIKAAAKDILLGKTDAGDKVTAARFVPFDDKDAPFIAIYAGPETVSALDNLNQRRVLDLYVECITRGEDAEQALDDITNQVEHAMVQDETMGGLVHEVALERTDPGYDEESRGSIQGAKMTFKVTYFVEAVADGPVDDFERAHIEETSGAFTDDVELPQ